MRLEEPRGPAPSRGRLRRTGESHPVGQTGASEQLAALTWSQRRRGKVDSRTAASPPPASPACPRIYSTASCERAKANLYLKSLWVFFSHKKGAWATSAVSFRASFKFPLRVFISIQTLLQPWRRWEPPITGFWTGSSMCCRPNWDPCTTTRQVRQSLIVQLRD